MKTNFGYKLSFFFLIPDLREERESGGISVVEKVLVETDSGHENGLFWCQWVSFDGESLFKVFLFPLNFPKKVDQNSKGIFVPSLLWIFKSIFGLSEAMNMVEKRF